ncbi:uncharacterized protein LOC134723322 [Mytilus trossulus]|uniref:uncharacterized protein LOC134723322 n=1 Tax=Mytilus trossulus TaxID=6551 RepID=UPI0030071FC7
MELVKKHAILIIIGYLFIEAGLLCGLFTNKWIKTKEYHFGLRRYCNNTIDGTICHNVVDILPNLEYMFDVVYYLLIASCSWISLVFIVMFSTLRCNGCKGKKTRRCTSLVMFSWCLIQGAVLTIFVTAIIDRMSASLSDAGWSLYLEGATLILSYVLLTIQVCCKDKSGRDSATVDIVDETMSYSIENILREENVIEGGHAPLNHIMNDPNAIYIDEGKALSYSIENKLGEGSVIEGGHAPMNHIMNDPNAIYQ